MNVSYVAPLRSSWSRMLRMLFRPSRFQAWLVLGFAAFLSEYLSWGFSGSRFSYRTRGGLIAHETLRRMVDFFHNPLGMALVLWVVLAAFAGYVLFLWISSRGKFIFLENVVRERAGIVEPWRRFRRLGNSLFWWRFGFMVACLLAIGAILLPFVGALAAVASQEEFRFAHLAMLLPLATLALPFGIFFAYVLLFLNSFVVPIMYKNDVSATAAWGLFLGLLRRVPGAFLLYGLFVLVLLIAVGIVVFAIGLGTCCIGFVLLGLPYVGSVLLLPVEITGRALGPEFLSQFGPEFALFSAPEPAKP
jgi:hypothetical protein